MGMESLALLPELRKLPAAEDAGALGHDEAVTLIRKMDRDHFAIEVSQATEETLEALFHWRNVPDVVNEAYRRSFSSVAERHSLYKHYQEMMEHRPGSVEGFVSKLKGTVAELQTKDFLEDRVPGSKFELPESPTQPVWDGIWRLPDGRDILVQVKTGAESYAPTVVEKMEESPNVSFAVSSEIYDRIAQSHPELVSRLIADIGPAAELTESVQDGLGTLAANYGVDVPDSIGEVLPLVGEVVAGLSPNPPMDGVRTAEGG